MSYVIISIIILTVVYFSMRWVDGIDYMKDNMDTMMFLGYLEGNTKKYMHRYRYKGKPVEDLKKARWYLDKLIQEMEGS